MSPINVYDVAGIRQLEAKAVESGILETELMQRAAYAVFRAISHYFPNVERVGIVVGGGKNGGDGLVLSTLLIEAGFAVSVYNVGGLLTDLADHDLLIDAICGIGLTKTLNTAAQTAVDAMNQANVPILAIDVPTGIHADTGIALGRPVNAILTVTFIGLKTGLLDAEGIQYTGKLIVDDLGLSPLLLESVKPIAFSSSLADKIRELPKRHANWHKGLSGHVLIIGGAPGFSGAPKMAALAALRVGAGLVSVLMHEDHAASFDNDHPEIMCHGMGEDRTMLETLINKVTVIAIGPGLGTLNWSKMLLERVVLAKQPLLLDADALNMLAEMENIQRDNWVLTPHPGEAARLLHVERDDIQQHRIHSATQLAHRYGGVAVLKGARTCVSDGKRCDISLLGNPGMATAGLGDILSGMIGGLMAQGLSCWNAATLGVLLHGQAGDLAAEDGMRGMVATDLLPYVRQLVSGISH